MTFTIQCAVSRPRMEMATEKKSLMIIDLPRYADGNLSRCHALATPLSPQREPSPTAPDLHEHARNLEAEAASRGWEPDYWIPCHSCDKPCGDLSCYSSLSIARALACCMVKNAVPRQDVAIQVSSVSDETFPKDSSNSIVPRSLLV